MEDQHHTPIPDFDIMTEPLVPPGFMDQWDDGRPGPVIKRMNQYRSEPVRWLEEGRIARGKLTLIAGDPGLGKSYMTLELAARVSRGDIGKADNCCTGQSVIMSAEDDPGDTLVPRLNSMCARLSNIHFIEGVRSLGSDIIDLPQLDRDTDRLIDSIRAIGDVSLVVIDPISAYMGRADSHNNAEVRCVLAQLSRLAQLTGAAVVCVTHLNKDSGGKRAIYRAMGSLAFTAAARTVHLVTKHPQSLNRVDRNHPDHDPFADIKRVVSMVKNNLGPILPPRVFAIDEEMLVWLDDEIAMDADQLDGSSPMPEGSVPVPGGQGAGFRTAESKVLEAELFLAQMVEPGPKLVADLFERGAALGLSKRTLQRARDTMGLVVTKKGRHYYWSRRPTPEDAMLIRESVETDESDIERASFGRDGMF